MGSLWASADTMTAARRNREAIVGRILGLPLHDVDNTAVVTVTPVTTRVAIAAAATPLGIVWTIPAGAATVVTSITMTNTHSAAVQVDLMMIEPGGTTGSVARAIWQDTLQAGEKVSIRVPFIMAASSSIRAAATVAAVVGITVVGLVFTNQPTGMNLKILEGVSVTTSGVIPYTCPASTRAIFLALSLCNTHSASVTAHAYVIPVGQPAGIDNQIFDDVLLTKETTILEDLIHLGAGDFIAVSCTGTTNVIGARLTVLELT
jgi:hypothetical protein